MSGEAWATLGVAITGFFTTLGVWLTGRAGKPANDAAEQRHADAEQLGQSGKADMSTTSLLVATVKKLTDEMADLRDEVDVERRDRMAEVASIRAEFDRERSRFAEVIRDFIAYVDRLLGRLEALGDNDIPTPTERVRRHLANREQ